MPVIDATHDLEALTLSFTAEFAATPDRVWDLYADPRQIERWFGPPGYPATFVEHDLRAGGSSKYFMTSPDGVKFWGWWDVESATPTEQFVHTDGFGDAEGNRTEAMPVSRSQVRMGPHEVDGQPGTTLVVVSTYASREDMQKVLDMGAVEGMTLAINQMDGALTS